MSPSSSNLLQGVDRRVRANRCREAHSGIPDPDGFMQVINAKHATLDQFINAYTKNFTYTCDFGDEWWHTFTVEAVTPVDPTL